MSGKIVLAKTALDGHWRGPSVVGRALRDAGFEVVLLGMARASDIAAVARDEDADLVGLNVGGSIEVVMRILDELEQAGVDAPVLAGGTIPPQDVLRLAARGVAAFPPGSSLDDIVAAAHDLVAKRRSEQPNEEQPDG